MDTTKMYYPSNPLAIFSTIQHILLPIFGCIHCSIDQFSGGTVSLKKFVKTFATLFTQTLYEPFEQMPHKTNF